MTKRIINCFFTSLWLGMKGYSYWLNVFYLLLNTNKFSWLLSFSNLNFFSLNFTSQISIRLLVTKPEDSARSEEATLRVSLQPLRLNVDQVSWVRIFFLFWWEKKRFRIHGLDITGQHFSSVLDSTETNNCFLTLRIIWIHFFTQPHFQVNQ